MMSVQANDVTIESILWQGFVFPGHEACRLFSRNSRLNLQGIAVFSYEYQPCRLAYQIICDPGWNTLSAEVEGWVGRYALHVFIKTDLAHRWQLNGVEQPDVAGCTDIDLNFSPSTNTLPIRRLNLSIGETAEVKAAWLRFPSFKLEMLPQQYRRLNEATYHYESGGGQFVAELKVNQAGFVVEYPGIWRAESVSG